MSCRTDDWRSFEHPAGDARLRLQRDDTNVFGESPSAIIFCLEGPVELIADDGVLALEPFRTQGDMQLPLPMQTARAIHAALGELIGEAPA